MTYAVRYMADRTPCGIQPGEKMHTMLFGWDFNVSQGLHCFLGSVFYTKIERKYWHPWLASSIESQRIYIFERKRNDNPGVLFVCLFLPSRTNQFANF